MAELTTKERDDARFMSLDGAAWSDTARQVVVTLSTGLVHQRRKQPTRNYQAAVAAILCDLLRAAESGRWSWRPFRPASFTGERIGYRPFKSAMNEMMRHGMVEVGTWGQQQWAEGFDGQRGVSWSKATRLRATPWLLRYLANERLTPDNWRDHFELIEPDQPLVKDPIVLRRRNVRHKGEKYRGHQMRVDLSDASARAEYDRMNRLNRFYMKHVIQPGGFRGLRRIYNNAESPTFNFNQGGRLYVVGGGYQTMKKAERLKLTIDGEAVAEIDVKASFISILSAMRRMPLDPHEDPYEIDGLPRPLVKAVVTMTLGHDRFHTRWPSKVKKDLEEKLGVRDLGKSYPLKKVLPLIVAKLPAMADWGNSGISCFDLQFVESEAMLLAVERLAYEHQVPTLPVHDSLIVPVSHLELARGTLADTFEEVTGHRPQLTVNLGDEGETEEGTSYSSIQTGVGERSIPPSRGYTGYTFPLAPIAELLRAPHRKIIELLRALAARER
jgi:hypothetical protein